MSEKILETLRKKYKIHPQQFYKDSAFIVTTADDFNSPYSAYNSEDITLLDTSIKLKDELKNKIEFLIIKQIDDIKFFQENINTLGNLKYLQIPFTYITNDIFDESVNHIISLSIVNSPDLADYLENNKKELNSTKILSGYINKNLTYLGLVDLTGVKQAIEPYISVTSEQFPNLEFISFKIDKKTKLLNKLNKFKNLKHINIRGAILDVIPYLNKSIKTLHIEGAGGKFSLSEIGSLENIEAVFLNSIQNELDCVYFLDCLTLKEIIIINSPKVKNLEVLLKMKNLESLEIVNCKKIVSNILKEKFVEKGIKRLEVDFS